MRRYMFSSAAYGSLAHFSADRFNRHTEDRLLNLFLSFEYKTRLMAARLPVMVVIRLTRAGSFCWEMRFMSLRRCFPVVQRRITLVEPEKA